LLRQIHAQTARKEILMLRPLLPLLLFACTSVPLARGDDAGTPTPTAQDLVESFKRPQDAGVNFRVAAEQAIDRLDKADAAADALAQDLLGATRQFVANPRVVQEIERLNKAGDGRLAAKWLLRIAMSKAAASRQPTGRPALHVAVGRAVPEDGRLDPRDVLMQSPVLDKGYFSTEVADLAKPLRLRARGYQDAEVRVADEAGDLTHVGTVTLKPLGQGQLASVKGSIRLDGGGALKEVRVTLGVMVPTPNTPGGGYQGRRGWPAPVAATVSASGEFVAEGLKPGDNYVCASLDGHVDVGRVVTLPPGRQTELGTLRLFSTDLGLYVGAAAPPAGPVAWEKDHAAALERAKKEGKPLFVMMTATWCGPCKVLEEKTLPDPWVRHFMSDFVMVKAYEDREVERAYGMQGYPTLVFVGPDGRVAHKFAGYVPTLPFAGHLALALDGMGVEKPEALKKLVAAGVVKAK
jgi:thiol-disulfide isomerase/thioredoxin